jgi:hypothetical protein
MLDFALKWAMHHAGKDSAGDPEADRQVSRPRDSKAKRVSDGGVARPEAPTPNADRLRAAEFLSQFASCTKFSDTEAQRRVSALSLWRIRQRRPM